MFGALLLFLDKMAFEDTRLEVITKDGEVFTGLSADLDEGDDDLGWSFKHVDGVSYDILYLKDIASVRRVGEVEYAYVANQELVEAV
ncbi:MAG: hypothetical protein FWG63_01135 [Defluviitaleaceae bacterium]|nr:hypothetical protein [Defluviitaleaceae bacterium]